MYPSHVDQNVESGVNSKPPQSGTGLEAVGTSTGSRQVKARSVATFALHPLHLCYLCRFASRPKLSLAFAGEFEAFLAPLQLRFATTMLVLTDFGVFCSSCFRFTGHRSWRLLRNRPPAGIVPSVLRNPASKLTAGWRVHSERLRIVAGGRFAPPFNFRAERQDRP